MQSDRKARVELFDSTRYKMAKALAEGWMNGEHELVRSTIHNAMDSFMREQWITDTAAILPHEQRQPFKSFVRG